MRMTLYKVRSGDTVSRLASRTPFDNFREERFRVLNGLGPREGLKAGQTVKLVQR